MIHNFKPYPAYKDSGVPWLGEVPAHWEMRRLKAIVANIVDQTSERSEHEIYLALEHVEGWTGKIRDSGSDVSYDSQVKRFQAGDVLFGKLRPYLAKVTCPDRNGVCVGEFLVLRAYDANLLPSYLEHLLRSKPNIDAINASTFGAKMPRADWQFIGGMEQLNPPLSEQAAIVRFLDHADRHIRRYIRAKQELIALLEERKQIIIHQAVTGQINVLTGQPYPAYQLFGVEWLGKVPSHWEVVQLRRVTHDRCDGPFGSGLKSSHYTEEGVRVVRLQNIGHGEFKDSDAVFISLEHYASLGDHSVVAGDILIAGLGDNNHPAGRACVAPENIAPAMVKADCFRFRLNQTRVHSRFAALQLTATATVTSAHLSTGATRQRTNLQSASTRPVAIPAIREQDLIVDYVSVKTSEVRAAQDAARREMDLLNDFRTRLIADVVTGKLDVREVAAELPEVDPLQTDHDIDGMAEATDLPGFDGEEDVVRLRD